MTRTRLYFAGCFSIALLAGCGSGSDSPTGPSTTVSAPTIMSPQAGATVNDSRPTLVIGNASVNDPSALTYSFQVATDSSFGNIVAEVQGIAQGNGETSWRVSPPLGNGQHFWRARARASNVDGPFSPAADFEVSTAFKDNQPRGGVLVFDPLTTGSSVGQVIGGELTEQGWKVIASSNRLIYDVPTIESGSVDFDITGLDIRNPTRDARHLFVMWDPGSSGDFTRNPSRVSLQKLDGRSSVNLNWLRLRFISQNRQIDEASSFRGWIPDKIHHIRFEWGNEGDVKAARLFVDHNELMFFQYTKAYTPLLHRVEMGAGMRAESHENAVYSNVEIRIRE